jgi:formamidopyrimidine-DNA glycosylase
MPELPEVEAVRRKLDREVAKAVIVAARLVRRPDRALEAQLRGRRIERVGRRGKNLLLELSGGSVLRVHLGMTGNLYALKQGRSPAATARAWLELEDGRTLVLDDPRALGRLELLSAAEAGRLACELGVEPTTAEFTANRLVELARGCRAPIKLFLTDQKRISGLGNIYAAEALFRAGIHPARPANRLSRRRLERLYTAIVDVLQVAIQSACNAYSGPGRFDASETFPLAVYRRAGLPCPRCRRRIGRIRQAGRSTYFCPGCQR